MSRMKRGWSLVKKYRMQSVFFSYLKMLSGATLLIIILYSAVLYTSYQKSQRENMAAFSRELLATASATMDGAFNEAYRYYTHVSVSSYTQVFLHSSQPYLSGEEYRSKILPIINNLTEFVSYSDCVRGVWLCSFRSGYVLSNLSGGNLHNFEQTLWMQHFRQTGDSYFVLPAGNSQDIFICRYLQEDGLLTVQIDASWIWESIQNGEYVKQLAISDKNNTILFASDASLIGKNLKSFYPEGLSYESLQETGGNFSKADGSGAVVAALSIYDDLVYTMRAEFPPALEQTMDELRNFFVGASLIILFMAGILSLLVTLRLYRSIANVSSLFYPAKPEADLQQINEISFISENILNLFQKQKLAEEELAERRKMLEKATNIALQTQIAPHFIFNTLQAIAACIAAEVREDNEAVQLVLRLGELLRITFDTKDNIIPLDLEIAHAKKYLEIQELKYGGMHTIVWQVQPEARHCRTLKLVLQPILENAIEHGFDSQEPENGTLCQITIRIYLKGQQLLLEVADNGKGIAAEELEAIRQKMNSSNIMEGQHIGLSNVCQRVRLTFGGSYGVSIDSVPGRGTTVQVSLPVIRDV